MFGQELCAHSQEIPAAPLLLPSHIPPSARSASLKFADVSFEVLFAIAAARGREQTRISGKKGVSCLSFALFIPLAERDLRGRPVRSLAEARIIGRSSFPPSRYAGREDNFAYMAKAEAACGWRTTGC